MHGRGDPRNLLTLGHLHSASITAIHVRRRSVAESVSCVSGDESKRLVGMQIPEMAVEAVLDKLEMQSGYKHVRQKLEPHGHSLDDSGLTLGSSNGVQPSQPQAPAPDFKVRCQYPSSWMQGDSVSVPIELD